MEAAQPILFWVIAGITAVCAIATVVTQNIVRCATWLLFTLAGVAGVMFLLAADLVGAIQILVYVGGTLVLVVFGVMLTAQGPFINMKASSADWAISAVVAALLLSALTYSVMQLGGRMLGPPVFREESVREPANMYGPKTVLSKDVADAKYSSV